MQVVADGWQRCSTVAFAYSEEGCCVCDILEGKEESFQATELDPQS